MLPRFAIPIIQAPMLGASTTQMATAVCQAGGLGSIAAGLSPQEMTQACADVRAATDRPFAVNVFVLDPAQPKADEIERAIKLLSPYHAELGLAPPRPPSRWAEDFAAQLAALVACAPPAASFTFGCLTAAQVTRLHAVGTAVIGTATTVAEARAWAAVGADAVCAQGSESGGHRGTFLASAEASLVGTMALVPAIIDAVDLPVIAAGGIMDGRGIVAALALGAVAVQLGTAFLLTDEATTSAPWRAAITTAGDDPTQLTRVFSGRFARGIENRFMRELRSHQDELPDYPVQNALTQELRAAAAQAGNAQFLSLWAGQGVRMARAMGAAQLVHTLWKEAQETLQRLGARQP